MNIARPFVLCLLTLAALTLGCGSSTPVDNVAGGGPEKPLELEDAKAVVQEFLAAFKTGNDALAEKLLTKKAIEETKKFDLVINVPGDESATFKILDVEGVDFSGGQGAHVLTQWTDGDTASPRTEECILVLRPEEAKWRIAGMIYRPFQDRPPVVFDFEDPQHMLEQMHLVEEEAIRRANAEANPASAQNDPFSGQQNPDDPPTRTATRPDGSAETNQK